MQHTHALLVAGAQLADQRIGDGVVAAEGDGHTAGVQDLADPLPHRGEAVLIAAVLDGDVAVVAAAHIVEGIEIVVREIAHIAGGDGADGLGGHHTGGEAAIGAAALEGHTHDRKVILLQFLRRFGGRHSHKGGNAAVNFIWDDTGLIDGRYRFQIEHTPLSQVNDIIVLITIITRILWHEGDRMSSVLSRSGHRSAVVSAWTASGVVPVLRRKMV